LRGTVITPSYGREGQMTWAERYRGYAEECMRLAYQSKNPADKALLVEMAASWTRMADRAEARSDTDHTEHDDP
jgi:hypothetical protein